ncbi:MAG: glycosyltransferase family 39 protein [bacterium]
MTKTAKISILVLTTFFASYLNLWQLASDYLFTDEILYVQAGQEYKQADYSLNLQHPLLGKYVSALSSGSAVTDVFRLRLPFAVLGVLSGLVVFAIARRELGFYWGILGFLLYTSLPFLHDTNRAVLLESPMHFFWLLFSYFLFLFYRSHQQIHLSLASVAFGLAMSVKFTSIVLLPALLVSFMFTDSVKQLTHRQLIRTLIRFAMISGGMFLLHYGHLIVVQGLNGLLDVVRAFKDVILTRNSQGKPHIVAGVLYQTSPWWFYLHYLKQAYGMSALGLAGILTFLGSKKKTPQSIYWLTLFVTSLLYFQLLSLKNARYLASIELPLVFLMLAGLKWLHRKYGMAVIALILIFVLPTLFRTVYAQPTAYHAAYLHIVRETANLTNGDRVLIFGSVRSAKWYFKAPEDVVVIRKDLEALKHELFDFKYILVDAEERLKFSDNLLFVHLDAFSDRYDKYLFHEVTLYVLKK